MITQISSFLKTHGALTNFSSIAGIGAALVLVGSGWRYIVGFFTTIRNLVLVRTLNQHEASDAMLSYILNKGHMFKVGKRIYTGAKQYINPLKRLEVVVFEDITNEPVFVWLDNRPFILKRSKRDNDVSTNSQPGYYDKTSAVNPIEITTIRGFVNFDELTLKAVEYFNNLHRADSLTNKNKRFLVRRLGKINSNSRDTSPRARGGSGSDDDEILADLKAKKVRLLRWSTAELGQIKTDNSSFKVFFFPPEVMNVVDEIRCWLKYEDWFKNKGIPWRLGCLFYGKAGTGKSTLIRSIAMELDLPVFILDLSTLDNSSLVEAWTEVQQNAPAIALIEDIDSVFNGRENVANTNVMRDILTYDCLLNTISGVKDSDGVLLCVTTNDITKLDNALGVPNNTESSTRPGRIDRAVELMEMRSEERIKVAKHVLSEYPELVDTVVKLGENETAAQFQNRCTTLALSRFWQNNKLI